MVAAGCPSARSFRDGGAVRQKRVFRDGSWFEALDESMSRREVSFVLRRVSSVVSNQATGGAVDGGCRNRGATTIRSTRGYVAVARAMTAGTGIVVLKDGTESAGAPAQHPKHEQ